MKEPAKVSETSHGQCLLEQYADNSRTPDSLRAHLLESGQVPAILHERELANEYAAYARSGEFEDLEQFFKLRS